MHFPDLGPARFSSAAPLPALIVFAARRWNLDHERLQQLLGRLARHYRVFHVEAPVRTHQDPHFSRQTVAPGIEVLVPCTPLEAHGFDDAAQRPIIESLLQDLLRDEQIHEPLVWLATPLALPLVDGLRPRGVLFDGADAPGPGADDARWRALEEAAMARADAVLAGGPSLYQARRGCHSNVHCLPNAVDAEHFAPAALAGSSIEAISARSLHGGIPGPRLGYFGAIDARLDLALIAAIADRRPDWQLVFAGPVIGIDPETLPRRSNVHWLGPQTYAILPHLQAHWDACLLPLKCDVAAVHASPRQALEYLAGQKSVVSTPVHDVVALYGHIVRLASHADAFVEACRAALCERGPLRRQRRIDALIAVHSCTWDRAADRVRRLLVEFAHEAGPAETVPPALLAAARRPPLRFAFAR